jgi:hypothetical protein
MLSMLLQVWVRGRRKNVRARSPRRAREWSAKIRSNPCGNAVSFCRICFVTLNLLRISRAEFLGLVTDLVFGTLETLTVPINTCGCRRKNTTEDAQHASTCLLRRRVRYFIPFVGVHRRSGEQVCGTSSSAILHWERANKVFGKRSARLLERFYIAILYVLVATARLPPHQWGTTWCRQAHGDADRRRRLVYLVIPVSLETYGFLFLTMFFIPIIIWLGLILLLQYFILNHLINMFTYDRFLYVIFVMIMIYLRINLKLKLLFIPSLVG